MKRLLLLVCLVLLLFRPGQAVAQGATKSPHGALKVECTTCHAPQGWKPARISSLFNHDKLGFRLTGAHTTAACRACHQSLDFKGTSGGCASCHQDVHRGELGADCSRCHTARSFLDRSAMARAHQLTRFPLEGAHLTADCTACHTPSAQGGQQFVARATTCVSCHEAEYASAKDPDHAGGGFPRDCAGCHTATLWTRATFDHNNTRFVLTGAHRTASCTQCHQGNKFSGAQTTCLGCHQADFTGAQQPNHVQAHFPSDCATCHSTTSWTALTYDHDQTAFPLTGAHRTTACVDCHADGQYKGKSGTCSSCHQKDFNGALTPNHTQAQFPGDCTMCHTTTAWQPAPYDHNQTRFPLTGAHKAATCADCHGDGVYKGKPATCVSCHQKDFNGALVPNHVQAQFPVDCTGCHSTTAWQPAPYDHNATQFPLTGAHKAATCADCHGDGVYKGKPTTCVSCHQKDFNGALLPNHVQAQLPTDCTACHSTTAWQPATFDHNATQFPLTGAHQAATCADCHGDGVYKGKSTTCVSCHQQAFTGATNPNHTQAQFPTDCTVCHTTTAWQPSSFDHSTSQFPLTGAHKAVSCNDCHADGVYSGKPTTCVSCHQQDFNAATLPNHVQSQFSTTCTLCHTTTAWQPASFDHSTTQFPLTGAHKPLACSQCHGDGVYAGKPTTCVSCHLTEYNNTADPNHKAAGFPTDCASCHTTTVWTGAKFDHDGQWFPIYSGSHVGRWASCSDCHSNPSNFAVFTCLTCHEHAKSTMDQKHLAVSGYQYASTECLRCHPRGTH